MGTIQLDAQMPQRFGLTYMGADNAEHTPYVIHRALLGSLERFIGILIEHYGGDFPFWLAPVQVRMIPVGEGHRDAVQRAAPRLATAGFRVEVDERDETVGRRIRDAELEKIPRVVVYGDRESDASLAVRERGGAQSTVSLDGVARTVPVAACYAPGSESRSGPCSSPPGPQARGGSTESKTRNGPLLAAVFRRSTRRNDELGDSL